MKKPLMETGSDWMRRAEPVSGVERIEAFFQGSAYALHRHDTYAIGRTLAGVQSFHYRSSIRHSLTGHTVVLHPDEPHDGHAGTAEGFRYRMVYVEPATLQQALGGSSLPFIAGGTSTDVRLFSATQALLENLDFRIDALAQDDALFDLAIALKSVSGAPKQKRTGDFRAAQLAREYIHDSLDRMITLDELAAASGRDRWSLSRDFRSFFGTSPYRYLTLRRLAQAQRLMAAGVSLADCAAMVGFADQSHMTRQFVKAFGLSPSKWLRIGK